MNIKTMVNKIKLGELSSEEVTLHYINAIEKDNEKINALVYFDKDTSLKKAQEIDLKIKKGQTVGALAGIPIVIKDNICTRDIRTTCGSKMLEDFIPPYDATVVKKLIDEDAIIIGKANMDEFAMGSSTETSFWGKTLNPIDNEKVPGGSSGGSAAAVCAKMAPVALGSDTGGSIRQPASFCNVVGLKPTYGLISRYGLIAFASSLDQIGPITNNVEDCAYILNIIAGSDPLDSTTIKKQVKKDYTSDLSKSIEGIKIGVPKEFIDEGLNKEIALALKNIINELKELGAEIEEFSLPVLKQGLAAYYIISSAEASSNLSRYDGIRYGFKTENYDDIYSLMENTRSEGFGKEVKRRIMLGAFALSAGYYDAYYKKATDFRTTLKEQLKETFNKYDLLIGPTSPVLPFNIDEKINDPVAMYLSDIYTVNINLAGIPALSLPISKSKEGLPIGLQIIGDFLAESTILNLAYILERKINEGKEVI